jgi:hypothetical protein
MTMISSTCVCHMKFSIEMWIHISYLLEVCLLEICLQRHGWGVAKMHLKVLIVHMVCPIVYLTLRSALSRYACKDMVGVLQRCI